MNLVSVGGAGRRHCLVRAIFIAAVAVSLAVSLHAAPARLAITISGQTVVVSGAVPGSEVLVFGVYQGRAGYFSTYNTYSAERRWQPRQLRDMPGPPNVTIKAIHITELRSHTQ